MENFVFEREYLFPEETPEMPEDELRFWDTFLKRYHDYLAGLPKTVNPRL